MRIYAKYSAKKTIIKSVTGEYPARLLRRKKKVTSR
jgi:hypothetical protein